MGKRKSEFKPTTCPYRGCGRLLDNQNNYDLHVKSCSKKHSSISIKSFFRSPSIQSSSNQSSDAVSSTSSALDDPMPAEDSVNIELQVEAEPIDVIDEVISNDIQTFEVPVKKSRCDGAAIEIDHFYSLYPFHRHDIENPALQLQHKVRIVDNEDGSEALVVHSNTCDTSLSEHYEIDSGRHINKMCLDVVESSNFKKMVKFANETQLEKTMNLGFHNYQQLENKYRDLPEKLN